MVDLSIAMLVHPVAFHRFWQIPQTRVVKIWTLLMALDIPHLHKSGKLTDHKPKITHVESHKTEIKKFLTATSYKL